MDKVKEKAKHPWLRFFTICGVILSGIVLISPLSPFLAILGQSGPVWLVVGIPFLVAFGGGVYTLKRTHGYQQWSDPGVFAKILAYPSIAVGCYLGFIIFAIPFAALGALFPWWFWWLPWRN